jgi:predicted RNA-binding Zn ribbon-like protein
MEAMHTHSIRRRGPRFELNGDVLCLDFVNTLDDRPSEQPKELLNSYADLAGFAEDTGILELSRVDDLMKRSQMDREGAQRALRAAVELREAMYAIFRAIMKKEPVPMRALEQLNGYVQDAARHARLVAKRGHFEWGFEDSSSLDAMLWPIARSASDLLASDQLKFVRACSSKSCQWFFLDTSKNHRRRWCKMDVCGNRAKARRFYARKKKR